MDGWVRLARSTATLSLTVITVKLKRDHPWKIGLTGQKACLKRVANGARIPSTEVHKATMESQPVHVKSNGSHEYWIEVAIHFANEKWMREEVQLGPFICTAPRSHHSDCSVGICKCTGQVTTDEGSWLKGEVCVKYCKSRKLML